MHPYFKNKGVGVGLRSAHHVQFLDERPSSVSWVEVISENYMPWPGKDFGRNMDVLMLVRKDYPVALHGVSLNIGSADALNTDYLKRLKQLIDLIEPFVVSDHLSWTGLSGENLHDLLPLPYTKEALDLVLRKIDQVQSILGRAILLENPSSYLEFRHSEMTEAEFIHELLNRSECGLLLDINNVYVSSVNHGFDPKAYLQKIPTERIGQIHLAGHSQKNGYLIDTHDAPVCAEVWELYAWSVAHFGVRSAMVERDGNIPDWQELEREILKIGEINDQPIPR